MISQFISKNQLGEGPVWHSERQSLFWVDILEKKLFEQPWQSPHHNEWTLPEYVGTVAIESENTVIVALQNGIARFDLITKKLDWIVDLEKEIPSNRANEGKCDPQGRLWQGTMDLDCKDGAGTLYCIDNELNVEAKITNLRISNGMAWSLDSTRFYFIDSSTYRIESYFFDGKMGDIIFEKTAITIPESMGLPDGMTIDSEGMLWVAHWGGFAVRRWDPDTSELLETIEFPAPQITSCTFGGPDFDHLFITSARVGMSETDLEKYPQSGNVFVVKTGVKARELFKFRNYIV